MDAGQKNMGKGERIVAFLAALALLLVLFYIWQGQLFPKDAVTIVIFASLLMLSFVSLFIEHYFTKPTDVIASTIAILLLLSPLRTELSRFGIWYYVFLAYNGILLVSALLALLLLDRNSPSTSIQNRASSVLNRFATRFGNGRFLYFVLFILTLLFYVDSQLWPFLVLFGYSTILLLIDPKQFVLSIVARKSGKSNDVGQIFGVQSKNTFLAKLFANRTVPLRRFDFVEFRYSMDPERDVFRGLVIDNYLLNAEQWVKVLTAPEIAQAFDGQAFNRIDKVNVIYKIDTPVVPEFLSRFVGVVVEDSNIAKLRFEYGEKARVSEGDLLEVMIDGETVLYQVVQGITDVELLESKNEAGFIIGEAVQLGIWSGERQSFDKFGWVPQVNTPVYCASAVAEVSCQPGDYIVGCVPNTNFPVILNKQDAITHHIALLGVTGSGKSVLARDLIRQFIQPDTKIICVDFTNEYRSKFADLAAGPIVADEDSGEMFAAIDWLDQEKAKFPNQWDRSGIQQREELLGQKFYDAIKTFEQSDTSLALFELPDVENTTGILEYTKWFFRILFKIAKKEGNFGKRICVILEEAHTVIPEWNFIGVSDKKATSLVNSIGQIALQGRKYGIGFVIIAQRTANVSKTVLTQCNSMIAFQQFDKTSGEFLMNYMGTEMVEALPNLRFRQAIAVGKAFRTNMPMIFEVPEITEQ